MAHATMAEENDRLAAELHDARAEIERDRKLIIGLREALHDADSALDELRELLDVWLNGDCPMHVEDCRISHLCQHCFENAVIDFDLPPTWERGKPLVSEPNHG